MKNGHVKNCPRNNCACEEKRYWQVLYLSLLIATIEFSGAYVSGSLSLVSDGFHVLTDGLAAGAAIGVAYLVRAKHLPLTEQALRKSGGYFNAALLILVAFLITKKAVERLIAPAEVMGQVMLITAAVGGFGNYLQHRILVDVDEDHVTHQGLHWHVQTDLLQSLAVVFGAAFIMLTGYSWIDPLLSLVITILIIWWAIKLIRMSLKVK